MTEKLPLVEFAPLEGITDGIFRQLHTEYFGGTDRYYTPFLSPTGSIAFTPKEMRLLEPIASNVVPQLLAKDPGAFCIAAQALCDIGFTEVNLNVGCPSGTVTAKGKGAALMLNLDSLARMLDGIFENPCCPISVKTRIGYHTPAEFEHLFMLYAQYPICRLIIHPRTKEELYAGTPHLEIFDQYKMDTFPISCNGSFRTVEEITGFTKTHGGVEAVMLGRGFVKNPALGRELKGGTPLSPQELLTFSNALSHSYLERFQSERNTVFRMKELWLYFAQNFEASERSIKEIHRAKTLREIDTCANKLMSDHPWNPNQCNSAAEFNG